MKIGQQQLSFLCVLLFSSILGIFAAERFSEGVPPFAFAGLLFAGIALLLWSARLVFAGSARIWGAAALLFLCLA